MRLPPFFALAPLLLTGCGLAVVRGSETSVLEQAREIHVVAGHRCVNDGNVVRCDEGDPKRNPLLVSAGANTVGLATYADAQPTFARSCADLGAAIRGAPQPPGYKMDCMVTKEGVDRLLIVALFPIPEGGMSDADFEAGVDAFMKDANGYVAKLRDAH